MFPTRSARQFLVAGALLLVLTVAPSVPAAADARPAAPDNLSATAYWDAVRLSWEPGTGGTAPIFYRVHNLTTGLVAATTATHYRWGGVEAGQVHSFEVTAVNDDGESPPSNRVSRTIPALGPPTDVTATLNGSTVTLTWNRPAAVDPGVLTRYGIRLGGALEAIREAGGDQVTLSIPRVAPGTTHQYTVQISRGVLSGGGPLSQPTTLIVPPATDTAPPTEAEWLVGLDPDCAPGHQIVGLSVDDVTPQPAIRYEGTGHTIAFRAPGTSGSETFVWDHHLPIRSQPGIGPPDGVRAVDEAGNRSGIVFDFEMDPSCG